MMVPTIKRVALAADEFEKAIATDPALDATRFVTKILDVRPTGRGKDLYFAQVGAGLAPEKQTVLPFVDKTDKFKPGAEVVLCLTKDFSVLFAEAAALSLEPPSPADSAAAMQAPMREAGK